MQNILYQFVEGKGSAAIYRKLNLAKVNTAIPNETGIRYRLLLVYLYVLSNLRHNKKPNKHYLAYRTNINCSDFIMKFIWVTPYSRILLAKLTVPYLVRKCTAFYGN